MVVAFDKVNAFNFSQDEWPLYVERLGYVFKANGITEEAKKLGLGCWSDRCIVRYM